MKAHRLCLVMSIMFLIILCTGQGALAIDKISPDTRAVKVVNNLLEALSIADSHSRLAAVIPLVHKSLLTNDGSDLARSVKDYSYKKAWQDVKFYSIPVRITEVHKGNVRTIGFKETAERGRVDKYFVGKKAGINGPPAPIHIFWPENGGEPRVINMGSL